MECPNKQFKFHRLRGAAGPARSFLPALEVLPPLPPPPPLWQRPQVAAQ